MKNRILFYALLFLVFMGCKNDKKVIVPENNTRYTSYGVEISEEKVLTSQEMLAQFKNINIGDTLNVKFTANINEVCTKKGCWMKLPLNDNTEAMVRFKDYGFFMPLDSKGNKVIVAGKAFVKETSVKELQHYAEDAGKTKEEIARITESKKEFAFEANGVLMKK
jgi:hypothetical protein